MPTMTAQEALDALGSTAEEARKTLAAAGIQGTSDPASCPIALWLDDKTGIGWMVEPHRAHEACDFDKYIDLPVHLISFVEKFDADEFPELIRH